MCASCCVCVCERERVKGCKNYIDHSFPLPQPSICFYYKTPLYLPGRGYCGIQPPLLFFFIIRPLKVANKSLPFPGHPSCHCQYNYGNNIPACKLGRCAASFSLNCHIFFNDFIVLPYNNRKLHLCIIQGAM